MAFERYIGIDYSGAETPNLSAARAFALAASSSRFFGGALVSMAGITLAYDLSYDPFVQEL